MKSDGGQRGWATGPSPASDNARVKALVGLTAGILAAAVLGAPVARAAAPRVPGPTAVPTVDNDGGATNLPAAKTSAVLRGTLTGGPADVFVCWGVSDGGTNTTAWQHVLSLGELDDGAFATNVTGVTYGEQFYYRCTATNAEGRAWAPATAAFIGRRPDLPVLDGLALWLDASQLAGFADGQEVETWSDASGFGRHAIGLSAPPPGLPWFVPDQLNGRPVVRFRPDGRGWFTFPKLTNIRSVFWVLKEASVGEHFLLGDDQTYHFHRGGAGRIWSGAWVSPNVANGTTRLMGNVVDGRTTALGGGYRLVSVVTAGDVTASTVTLDRGNVDAQRAWEGDIAEILIYSTALTGDEERRVGSYLTTKYALPANYTYPADLVNGLASDVTTTSAVLNASLAVPDTVYDVRAYWGTADGGTNAEAWAFAADAGRYTNAAPANLAWLVTGLASNTVYFYTFRATNLAEGIWASPSAVLMTGEVDIEATEPLASEAGPTAGGFTVSRPVTATNVALTVYYTVGGTASNGVDYAWLNDRVTIPEGSTSATIAISAVDRPFGGRA